MPINVFISYSHKDENYQVELKKHLTNLVRREIIRVWTDHDITPGDEWSEEISGALKEAQIILPLVSSDFLHSDYCYEKELSDALKRQEQNEAKIIPIIIRHCDWEHSSFSHLQALPKNAKPISSWNDKDEAYLNVVDGIKKAIDELSKQEYLTQGRQTVNKSMLSTTTIGDEVAKEFFELMEKFNTINNDTYPDVKQRVQQKDKLANRMADIIIKASESEPVVYIDTHNNEGGLAGLIYKIKKIPDSLDKMTIFTKYQQALQPFTKHAILDAIGKLIEKGYIERREKPYISTILESYRNGADEELMKKIKKLYRLISEL